MVNSSYFLDGIRIKIIKQRKSFVSFKAKVFVRNSKCNAGNIIKVFVLRFVRYRGQTKLICSIVPQNYIIFSVIYFLLCGFTGCNQHNSQRSALRG